jgi:transcriptional regulator with PAS, ATPase and Fis domain
MAMRESGEDGRWPALFRRSHDPVFVTNRRRRVVFVNAAWEALTGVSSAEARGLTCTARDVGHSRSELMAVLAPPAEVLGGEPARVRRPPPARDSGPPWWDIDFLPINSEGRLAGIVGRVRLVPSSEQHPAVMPSGWAQIRSRAVSRFNWSLWESQVPQVRLAANQGRLVASTGANAVLVGPRGAGKQTMARTIHASGQRRELPCVCLECDRLPPAAVQSAIAATTPIGLIYLASPASLPGDLQLEILQRSGGRTQLLIGVTSDPAAELARGDLSVDLWAATAMIVIRIPPLADRGPDFARLTGALLASRTPGTIAAAAVDRLRSADWPENIDGLRAVIGAAADRAAGRAIDVDDLPYAVRENPAPPPRTRDLPRLDDVLEHVERRMIALALKRSGGNQSAAAKLLDVWRPRLLRRLDQLKSGRVTEG